MLMQPPSPDGDSFVGNDGFTYAGVAGASVEVGNGAVRQALLRNWTELPYPAPAPGGSGPPTFTNLITATLATTQHNYSGGGNINTNAMDLQAASGGSTITGFDVTALGGALVIKLHNTSATDPINFPHQSSSSLAANQLSNQNGGTVQIPALGSALLGRGGTKWTFLS